MASILKGVLFFAPNFAGSGFGDTEVVEVDDHDQAITFVITFVYLRTNDEYVVK